MMTGGFGKEGGRYDLRVDLAVRADFALLRLDPGWLEPQSDSATFKTFLSGLPTGPSTQCPTNHET